MAVPTVVAVGAANAGATTAVTPAFPAGMAVDDIIIGIGESAGASTYPDAATNGFAHVTGSPVTQDTQTVLTVIWARYDGVMTAHSWGDSGNHNIARYIAIRGVTTSDPPWDPTPAASVESVADTSAAWPAVTTTVADCLVLFAIATGRDLATTTNLGALTGGTGLTGITEQMDNWTAAGTGGGFGLVTATKAAAGSTGSPTATMGSTDTKAFITLALEPVPTTASKTLTDAGAADDQLNVDQGAVTKTLAESGQGSDQLRPAAAVALADSGAAAETLRPAAAVSLPDQGTAADALRPAAIVLLSEGGAAADSLAVATPPVPVALTDTGTAAEHLCHDGGPDGAPDCILDETNLAGDLTRLWDDPAAPDANWLTALDPTLATDLRVSFPTPTTAPGAGGPTVFQTLVRKTGAGPDPTVSVQLWEAGAFVKELATATVASTSGQLVTATLTPADLIDSSGAEVELRVRTLQPGDDGLYHDSYDAY